ncbi:MAG: hypothetical protein GX495_11590 [Chloroflexi bacterium]|nr:hypothetical protein [Chloroflexota bacterium]
MLKKLIPALLITAICLLFTGCRPEQVPQVMPAEPVSGARSYTSLEIRNCDDAGEIRHPLQEISTVTSQVEIAQAVTALDSGAAIPLPAELQTELAEQVRQTYQPELEAAQAQVAETELVVPHPLIRRFFIYMHEKTWSGVISLEIDGQACEAAYTYRLSTPYINDYRDTACTA